MKTIFMRTQQYFWFLAVFLATNSAFAGNVGAGGRLGQNITGIFNFVIDFLKGPFAFLIGLVCLIMAAMAYFFMKDRDAAKSAMLVVIGLGAIPTLPAVALKLFIMSGAML